jgi:DNA-binding NtrC family response regulator
MTQAQWPLDAAPKAAMTCACSSKDLSVVVIDNNPSILEDLRRQLSGDRVRVFTAQDPRHGVDIVYRERPQLVVTGLVMSEASGIEVLDRVVEFDPSIDVILMTAHPSAETTVEAIRRGAVDYLPKPVSIDKLRARVERMLDSASQCKRVNSSFHGIVGRSAAMSEVYTWIERVAPHYRTVLIGGETGTGKELLARAIHDLSPVRGGNFVTVNCSAVVESLFESELFGHVRGSFTGALQNKPGLFEYADKGTLFLDEIGELSLPNQAKLLRVLQNREVLRVGSLQPHRVDVRIIAATNRDLRAAVHAKKFREDLYYRLAIVEIKTPPLVARPEDVPLLTRHFVERFSAQFGKRVRRLTARAEAALASHSWPGNVRELENAIGHACIMAAGDVIDISDLPLSIRGPAAVKSLPMGVADLPPLKEQERRLIVAALREAKGNQREAAKHLSIGRDALRYKMRQHGLFDIAGQLNPSTQPGLACGENLPDAGRAFSSH